MWEKQESLMTYKDSSKVNWPIQSGILWLMRFEERSLKGVQKKK